MQPTQFAPRRLAVSALLATLISACGGGSNDASTQLAASVTPANGTPVQSESSSAAKLTPPSRSDTPATTAPAAVPTVGLTYVQVQNTGTAAQSAVPLTFGQVFTQGDLKPNESLVGQLSNGTALPLQVDVKARHPDGTVRHAIISAVLPSLAAGATESIALVKNASAPVAPAGTTPAALLANGFKAAATITINGVQYSAAADTLLASGKYSTWLSGAAVNEWHVSAPLTTASGTAHPHLSARFAIRAASGNAKARVDVTIENDWAYEAQPQNFTYDAQIIVAGQTVYSKAALTHFHHARWRKVFWWGGEPQVHIKHNTDYIIATRAVPNYDRSVSFSEAALNSYTTQWAAAKTEPMGTGLAMAAMATTGGRPDIGLLPGWATSYLLSMDKRAKSVTLATADLAGSYSLHYRNKATDRPISLAEFPYMTILGHQGDTLNPATKKYEWFPACATATACASPNSGDTSHQPGFAYLPYMLTGDYYYLEELQFLAHYATFWSNPYYREFGKGLVKSDQVRGQAWSLRTLGEAAYITPDNDAFKPQFAHYISTNLAWYDANYTNNAAAPLGILTHGYALGYENGTGMAPWMDDFFTSAIGHLVELGNEQAKPLLAWKARFPIDRMTGAGTCWINAAVYALKVRDSATSPFYTTIGQAYKATHPLNYLGLSCGGQEMATYLKMKVGEMTGYSGAGTGYPSNLQPALAYAADAAGGPGMAAWNKFAARSVKPDYSLGPQFAIVPRR